METIFSFESKIISWLRNNCWRRCFDLERSLSQLKVYGQQKERDKIIIDFFNKSEGKDILDLLPEDIKNYILAHSL
jgi:hypothetical protein